jgi:anti-sigma-K factor RskA
MRDHEAIRQSIAAYALDALDPDERAAIEHDLVAHLPGCEECSALLRDFREVASELALGASPRAVSPESERRLFAAVRSDHAALARPGRRRGFLMRIAAVAAVLALGASLSLNGVLASRSHRSDASAARLAAAVSVLGNPRAKNVALRGRQGSLLLVYGPGARAVLIGRQMPAPPRGRVFELWLLRGGETLPVGTFSPTGGRLVLPLNINVSTARGVAVTIESRFVRAPTTAPVYAGSLEA